MVADNIEIGDTIIKQGDVGDRMFVLYKGNISVVVGGREVAVLDQSRVFGESALVNNEPRNATIVAKTRCELFMLFKSDYD